MIINGKNYKISGFADEIADSFEEQLIHIKSLGIEYIEVRGVNGKNISTLSEEEMKMAKVLLDKYGIAVSAIGSPIGKVGVNDDFDKHINVFMNVIKAALILDTKNIRVFSFYLPEEDGRDGRFINHQAAVFAKMEKLLDIADENGVVLCHENERGIYGDSPEGCLDLMKKFGSRMKFVFDPANFIVSGYEPYPYAFGLLKQYIGYVHIKDAKPYGEKASGDSGIYPAGGGNGKIKEMLADLFAEGFDSFLSIEPHLSVFAGIDQLEHGENKLVKNKFASKKEAFDAAFEGLKSCLPK